ncbi:MAG: OmpA family protein [Planctomycetes bacterium]|nr:OmpA family protein [Planctomycetota bacterium]
MMRWITAVGLLASVAGCAQEAGQSVDTGTFGNATMNNTMVMDGSKDYALVLGQKFAEQVPNTVNFAFNEAQLDSAARQILNEQAGFILQFPEVRFRVYGYTDLVGSAAYNKALGQRRADAVVAYLTSRGISRSRLESVVSFGKTHPVINTPGPEVLNRRAVTEVTGFVKRHPTVMDGKYAEIVYREYIASAVPHTGLAGYEDSGGFAAQQQ